MTLIPFRGPSVLLLPFLAAVLTLSCTGGTVTIEGAPFPVGKRTDAIDHPGLLGVWEHTDPEDGSFSRLSLDRSGIGTFGFSISDAGESEALSGNAFVVDIDGAQIMNLELVSTPDLQASGYLHFLYSLYPPDTLTLRLIQGSEDMSIPFEDPDTLYAFVKNHAHDDELYGEPVAYKRVQLW